MIEISHEVFEKVLKYQTVEAKIAALTRTATQLREELLQELIPERARSEYIFKYARAYVHVTQAETTQPNIQVEYT